VTYLVAFRPPSSDNYVSKMIYFVSSETQTLNPINQSIDQIITSAVQVTLVSQQLTDDATNTAT